MNEQPPRHIILAALSAFLDKDILETMIQRWTTEQLWETLQTYQSRKK